MSYTIKTAKHNKKTNLLLNIVFVIILFFNYSCIKDPTCKNITDGKSRINKSPKQKKASIMAVMKKMSIDEMAGQMVTTYPSKKIMKQNIGGIILTDKFVRKKETTKKLIQKYNQKSKIPIFVMIDQEGGRVNRLKKLKKYKNMPSPQKMASWSEKKIVDYTFDLGDFTRKLGINTILAPCLDISSEGSLMYKLQRSFSHKLDEVQKKGGSFAKGLYWGGVIVIGKHFPGYGDVKKNSDVAQAVSDINEKSLKRDISAFKSCSDYLDGLMMSSIVYHKISKEPAAFSKKLVSLAKKILPSGIIITDDIQAKAVKDYTQQKLKKTKKLSKNKTIFHDPKNKYSYAFTGAQLEMAVEKAFNAGITVILTMDYKKAVYIKNIIKKIALSSHEGMEKLKRNVCIILNKKHEMYPEYFK